MRSHTRLGAPALILSLTAVMADSYAGSDLMRRYPAEVRALIDRRLDGNTAYQRYLKRPAYDPGATAGFVKDEAVKAAERRAARALTKDLFAAYTRGDGEFAIPPGEYRFSSNKGLTIKGWRNFAIDARGATFWFERAMDELAADPKGLRFVDCARVKLTGLKIDFDPPVYIQATIKTIDNAKGVMAVEVDPDWPVAAMGGGQFTVYKPDGRIVPQHVHRSKKVEHVAGRTLRVTYDPGVMRGNFDERLIDYTEGLVSVAAGDHVTLNFRRGRSLFLGNCSRMVMEDIDIYQSPGMGVLEVEGAGGHLYRRIRLIRKPGTRRLHVGCADAFHSSRMRRGSKLIECEFSHTSDDMVNLHGYFGFVWKSVSPTRVLIGTKDKVSALKAGGPLTFYDKKHVTPQGEARIAGIDPVTDPALTAYVEDRAKSVRVHAGRTLDLVTLDRPVETSFGSLVDFHANNSPGFLIRDCFFHDARARGALLSGVRNGSLENCIFLHLLCGPVTYMESWLYMEGPVPGNVTFRNNLVIENLGPYPGSMIGVGLVPGGGAFVRRTWPIRQVDVIGNVIADGGILVNLLYLDGGSIRDNVLVNPLCFEFRTGDFRPTRTQYGNPGYYPRLRRAAISAWSCRNLRIEDNRVYVPKLNDLRAAVDVGDRCSGVAAENNVIIRYEAAK